MQSTNEWKEWRRYFSTKENVSTVTRRERMRSMLKAAMEAWARRRLLVLLFVASLAFIAFGEAFVASSPFGPETSIATVAVKPEDLGNAPRDENLLSLFATPAETIFLPSSYVRQR